MPTNRLSTNKPREYILLALNMLDQTDKVEAFRQRLDWSGGNSFVHGEESGLEMQGRRTLVNVKEYLRIAIEVLEQQINPVSQCQAILMSLSQSQHSGPNQSETS